MTETQNFPQYRPGRCARGNGQTVHLGRLVKVTEVDGKEHPLYEQVCGSPRGAVAYLDDGGISEVTCKRCLRNFRYRRYNRELVGATPAPAPMVTVEPPPPTGAAWHLGKAQSALLKAFEHYRAANLHHTPLWSELNAAFDSVNTTMKKLSAGEL